MKNFRLKAENPDHFVIHDTNDKSDFKVAKAHLDLPMMVKLSKIQKYESGGEVSSFDTPLDTNAIPESTSTQEVTQPSAQSTSNQTPIDPEAWTIDANNNPIQVKNLPITEKPFVPTEEEQNTLKLANRNSDQSQLTQASPQGGQFSSVSNQNQNQAQTAQGMQDPYTQYLQSLQSTTGQQQQANTQIAQATKAIADEQARIEAGGAAALQNAQTLYQKHFNDLTTENQNISQQVANTIIDPEHYWNSKSTASKIGMLGGMIISGFGANASQGNMAENIIEKSIDDDINAQKANLGKTQSLLSNNLAKFGNLNTAMSATRANLLSVVQGQLSAAAMKQGGAIAQANAQNANAELDRAMAGVTQQVAMQRMGFDLLRSNPNQNNNAPIAGGINQNKYLGLKYSGFLDPKDEPGLNDEMTRYGKLQSTLNFIDDQGNKLNSLQKAGNYALHPIDTRTVVEATKDNLATAASKDAEGRINETVFNSNRRQAQDLIDSPEAAAAKIENLKDSARMLHGSFPLLTDRYGLLNTNDPALISGNRQKQILQNKFKPVAPNQQNTVAGKQ